MVTDGVAEACASVPAISDITLIDDPHCGVSEVSFTSDIKAAIGYYSVHDR